MSKEKSEGWVFKEAIFRTLSHDNVLSCSRIFWDQLSQYTTGISEVLHIMVPNSNNHNLFSSDYPAFRWVQTIIDYIFECILYRRSRKRFFIIWRNNIYKEAWQFQSIQPSIGRSRSRNTSVAVEKAHSVEVFHSFVRNINAILSSYLHHILDIFVHTRGMWWAFSAV